MPKPVHWRLRLPHRFGAAGCAAVVLLVGTVSGQSPQERDFYCDFRKQALPPEVELFNDPDRKFCRFEPEGLRITVPRTDIHASGGVGVRTSFELHGDFVVTATMEVLALEQPPSGSGAGITLYLPTVAGDEGAFIGRLIGIRGKHILLCSRQIVADKGSTWQQHPRPCPETLLRVQLKRTGTQLTYLYAPGVSGGDFEQVHRTEFTPDDIRRIRLTAANSQTGCAMDVRLIDLHIHSGVPAAASSVAATPPRGQRATLILATLGLCFALLIAGWLYVQRSRTTAPAKE